MRPRDPVWEERRRQGLRRAWARKNCTHPEWEKVPFLSGGAGTHFLRCKACGKYEAQVKQYKRDGQRGKKVREVA